MNAQESRTVQKTLEQPNVHTQWIGEFYTAESNPFYEAAFDHIAAQLASREKACFLDAGCGDGVQTVRLAQRGFPVFALDFSEYIIGKARENVATNKLERMVRFQTGSLLNLPLENRSFDFVLCWGVLMHIPEVEKAIAELARVVKPNGFLIITENNMWSLESVLDRSIRRVLGKRILRRLRGKEPADYRITQPGVEYWRQTDAGPLMCREARISWLIATVASHGFVLRERVATEFTELHASVQAQILKRWLWKLNLFWFKYIRLPQPAKDNLLRFQRSGP